MIKENGLLDLRLKWAHNLQARIARRISKKLKGFSYTLDLGCCHTLSYDEGPEDLKFGRVDINLWCDDSDFAEVKQFFQEETDTFHNNEYVRPYATSVDRCWDGERSSLKIAFKFK